MTLILDIQVAKAWVLLFILAVIVYFFIVNWISFPSYNIAISLIQEMRLIALHSGAQEETPERDTYYLSTLLFTMPLM